MMFTPQEEARLSYWLKTKDRWIDYIREENKHMYDVPMKVLSIRGSFMCTRYDHIKDINGFEYINKAFLPQKIVKNIYSQISTSF